MAKPNGEQIFGYFLLLVGLVLLVGLTVLSSSPKHIHSYTLGSGGSSDLEIRVDIENSPDDYIPLIGVDYKEAVALVDSLNKTIKTPD